MIREILKIFVLVCLPKKFLLYFFPIQSHLKYLKEEVKSYKKVGRASSPDVIEETDETLYPRITNIRFLNWEIMEKEIKECINL